MIAPSRYWEMRILDVGSLRGGCKSQPLPLAYQFFQQQFPELAAAKELSEQQDRYVQSSLLSFLHPEWVSSDPMSCVQAGLCLRCYVSYSIESACGYLAHHFGTGNIWTYRDLLVRVLNDDGKTPIILKSHTTQQFLVDRGEIRESYYKFFMVEIIQKFNCNLQSQLSLGNWAYRQTRQNRELKDVLREQGLWLLSDWALLNRTRPQQLQEGRDRILVEVFHAVYRRDRPQQRQKGVRRCPNPSNAQLQEMLHLLQEHGVSISSQSELFDELKTVVSLMRRPTTESLDYQTEDPETGETFCREYPDSQDSNNLEELEQKELALFCDRQLIECLDWAIAQGIEEHIQSVKKRPRNGSLAQNIKPALHLLYYQRKSQTEIASLLGFQKQYQVSRLLEPKVLLSKIRTRTLERLLENILEKAKSLGFTEIPASPDYLSNLMQQLDVFVDEKVFNQAVAEINIAKNRLMDSLYAQRIRCYLETCMEENYG